MWTLVWALLVVGSLSLTSWADNKLTPVGKIIDVDGPVLMTNRMTEDRWYQGYVEMPTYLSERLKADSQTSATIQFYKGGRAVISPGTQVEVITTKSLQTLKVEVGTVWAKFDKQESQFRIETAGGVMGIEGTEFFVEAEEDGETTLTVVEGQVRVMSGDDEKVVTGGEEANFRRGVRRFQRFAAGPGMTIRERREAAFQKLGIEGKPFQRYILTRGLTKSKRGRQLNRLFYGKMALRSSSRKWQATLQSRRRNPRPSQQFEIAGVQQTHGLPGASWSAAPSRSYAVTVLTDADGEDVLWQGRSDSPSFTYPDYGPELTAGQTYYLEVVPLKFDGSPQTDTTGEAIQATTSFVADGHVPEYGTLSGLAVSSANRLPELKWSDDGAAAYLVKILSDSELVWAGETESAFYAYPATARALDTGRYTLVVESFDEFGVKMGESEPLEFETEGWTSTGLDGPPRE